jgi:hypothetical protein
VLIKHSRFRYEDARGVVRSTTGCSLFDRFEFNDCCTEIQELLEQFAAENPEQDTEILFKIDKQFQWLIVRALELNGIEFESVAWSTIESMLFFRIKDDQICAPWLIELNKLKPRENNKPPSLDEDEDDQNTLANIIAGISHATGGIDTAVEISKQLPTDFLLDILEARAKQLAPPDKKGDIKNTKRFKDTKRRLEAEMREAMAKGEAKPFIDYGSIDFSKISPIQQQ